MDLIEEFFLEAFPNPDRKGCPDEETLMAFADKRLPAEHPARLHVFSCSECFAEYSGYRLKLENAKAAQSVTKTNVGVESDVKDGGATWGLIASNLSVKIDAAAKAIKRARKRIAAHSHR